MTRLRSSKARLATAALAGSLLGTATAQAHIVLAERAAPTGSFYLAVFQVPHGCAGAATTSLEIEIPGDITGAKPQPKPGWSLQITHEKLEQPIRRESGGLQTERVKTVTWRGGSLPDDEFDSFTIMVHLPDRPGPLYFPTVQGCGTSETRWTEIPAGGKTPHDVPHPPLYVILSAPAAKG